MKANLLRAIVVAPHTLVSASAPIATAGPGAQHCNTSTIGGAVGSNQGTYTRCEIITDDVGWYTTETYCDNNGNCSVSYFDLKKSGCGGG